MSWVNIPPVSDSGAEQTVDEGTTVTLDGSKSADADDGIALDLWKQVSGIPVTLSDTTAIQSSFTAPEGITKKESLEFNLTVEDGGGLQSSDSCVVSVTPVIQQQISELTVSSISVRLDSYSNNKTSFRLDERIHNNDGINIATIPTIQTINDRLKHPNNLTTILLIFSHAWKSLNPRDKMTAPIDRPMNPIEINPPIEPRKITSMGTGAPCPIRIGFRKLSDNMTKISQTINSPAVSVSA